MLNREITMANLALINCPEIGLPSTSWPRCSPPTREYQRLAGRNGPLRRSRSHTRPQQLATQAGSSASSDAGRGPALHFLLPVAPTKFLGFDTPGRAAGISQKGAQRRQIGRKPRRSCGSATMHTPSLPIRSTAATGLAGDNGESESITTCGHSSHREVSDLSRAIDMSTAGNCFRAGPAIDAMASPVTDI